MTGKRLAVIAGIAAAIGAVSVAALIGAGDGRQRTNASPTPSGVEARTNFPVVVNNPGGAPKVDLGLKNFHGEAVSVSCSTCHATAQPNRETRSSDALDEFHQGLQFAHGSLSCLSCHNAGDYDTLRLADGAEVAFQDVMTMCAQCHGPQARDYRNGSHGGMTGYWDLTRGPRRRNNCIDCHDPHAPAYPQVMPVFPQSSGRHGTKAGASHEQH